MTKVIRSLGEAKSGHIDKRGSVRCASALQLAGASSQPCAKALGFSPDRVLVRTQLRCSLEAREIVVARQGELNGRSDVIRVGFRLADRQPVSHQSSAIGSRARPT